MKKPGKVKKMKKIGKKLLVMLIVAAIIISYSAPVFASETDTETKTDPVNKIAVLFAMEDYSGTSNDLIDAGSYATANLMETVLTNYGYTVYKYFGVNKSAAISAINSAYAGSTSNDELFFYFAGHGALGTTTSFLCFTDGSTNTFMSVDELQGTLSQHSGTKTVLLDACHSGGFINKDGSLAESEEELDEISRTLEENPEITTEIDSSDYNNKIMAAFETTSKDYLNGSEYKVLTAASADQLGYALPTSNGYLLNMGNWFIKGAGGYNSFTSYLADSNGNSQITFGEIADYTITNAKETLGWYQITNSDVQVYPSTTDTYVLFGDEVAPSSNANLSDLTVNGSTVDGFSAVQVEYTIEVSTATTSAEVQATAEDGNATVTGTGSQALEVGSNQATVTVEAEDGTTQNYSVNITRLEEGTEEPEVDPEPEPESDPEPETEEPTGDKIALLFGMSDYAGTGSDLQGPVNDVAAMESVLQEDGYTVYSYENVSEEDAKYAIATKYANSDEDDTLLFYYSGHGSSGTESSLVFTNSSTNSYMYVSELTSALNAHEGTKVVLIDSCYSGDFISRSIGETTEEDLDAFNSSIVSAFEDVDIDTDVTSRDLTTSDYKVLAASSGDSYSYEGYLSGATRGFFTYAYTKGTGYFNSFTDTLADDNDDTVVTHTEMYNYISANVSSSLQEVQAYPYENGDSSFVLFGNGTAEAVAPPTIDSLTMNPEVGYSGDTFTATLITDSNADKLAFYSEGEYHSQLTSVSSGVEVTNNGDGTSTWEISMTIGKTGERTFSYKAHNDGGWSELASVYFTVEGIAPATIDNLTMNPEVGYSGDTFTATFETDSSVTKIAFYSEGEYHSQLYKTSTGVDVTDNGDGTSTWEISMKVGKTGERTFSYKAYNEGGWGELSSVNFTVEEIAAAEVYHLSIDPEIGYAGDIFTATLITDSNVTKIAFYSEGYYHSQLFKNSKGVTVTDNGDGTATWTISKKIGRKGERTFSYKAYNEGGWSEIASVSFSVIDRPAPEKPSVSVNNSKGSAGEYFVFSIETDASVDYLGFYVDSDSADYRYIRRLYKSTDGVTVTNNGDGTATWTYRIKIGKTGDRMFSFKAHNSSGWSGYGSVEFVVN
jgi:hypothetical protein